MTLPSNGLTRIAGDFAPPVARARTIEGDAGHGPSAPKVVSADGRIIISRRGLITCSDPLFEREFWRVPTGDRWAGVRIVGPDVLLTLPGTPMLVDVASGRVVAEYRNPDITVAASTGWLFSYDTTTKQSTLASAGGEILFRGSLPAGVVFDDAVVCFSHDVGSAVTCVPLNAPDRRWTWKVPPAGDELVLTEPLRGDVHRGG